MLAPGEVCVTTSLPSPPNRGVFSCYNSPFLLWAWSQLGGEENLPTKSIWGILKPPPATRIFQSEQPPGPNRGRWGVREGRKRGGRRGQQRDMWSLVNL